MPEVARADGLGPALSVRDSHCRFGRPSVCVHPHAIQEPRHFGHAPRCRSAQTGSEETLTSPLHYDRSQSCAIVAAVAGTARRLHTQNKHALRGARYHMTFRLGVASGLAMCCLTVVAGLASGQTPAETFSATAAVTTASGAAASSPVTVVVSRKMSQAEVEKLTSALHDRRRGGAAQGAGGRGRHRIDSTRRREAHADAFDIRAPDRSRAAPHDRGRSADSVRWARGCRAPSPKEGYDFAILDLIVDAQGGGSGTLAPAAKISVKQGAFMVDDYAAETVRLTDVKIAK